MVAEKFLIVLLSVEISLISILLKTFFAPEYHLKIHFLSLSVNPAPDCLSFAVK